MNSIIYNEKIITPEYNIWGYYKNVTRKLDKRDCIKFALFCAKSVNPNTKETNLCIRLVEKCLVDEKSVTRQELKIAAASAASTAYNAVNDADAAAWSAAAWSAAAAASAAVYATYYHADINDIVDIHAADINIVYYASSAAYAVANISINKINKYLQILLRKTKQFGNNKILEQISKTDVDKLELVDWNMITDIMLEEYNIIHEFEYEDIFSRRCLIELLRREYEWHNL